MATSAERLATNEEISDELKQAIWNGDVESAFRYMVLLEMFDLESVQKFITTVRALKERGAKDMELSTADAESIEELAQISFKKKAA